MHDLPNRSLAVQRSALQSGALIPLKTELISGADERFQLRRLISATPKHLTKAGPKPNPFRPWDPRLEVACQPEHVVLLNKYPVQA
ncbi:MAG TPA: ATP adenylyltransferase, partial [Synechococcales bacterium UBA12195]|nr:ATP adenylyltransferase [Synechococcales bacterium UBA12195]